MPDDHAPPDPLFVGGYACLDFCNTLAGRDGPAPRERAGDPAALAAWCERAFGVRPRIEAVDWTRLIRLRAALHALFDTVALATAPDEAAVALLEAEVAEAAGRRRLVATPPGFAWRDAPPADGVAIRHRLAMDALALLTEGDSARLKRCDGHDCGWLFYDRSKNGSRRWCQMSDCGTAAKVRRFRQRKADRS